MKNFIQLFSLVCCTAFLLASCSQSKDLAQTDTKDQTRMYYKEYIGNKIIYHDKIADENTTEEHIENDIAAIEEEGMLASQNAIIAPPKRQTTEDNIEESPIAESAEKLPKAKPFVKGLVSKIKQNHNDVVSGKIFTKKYHKDRNANNNGSRAFGASEIFGLLALIFGAASFTFGVAGLVFGVLGLVFGIIGLDAESFWGVFALVGLILGAVGAALSFIFLIA